MKAAEDPPGRSGGCTHTAVMVSLWIAAGATVWIGFLSAVFR